MKGTVEFTVTSPNPLPGEIVTLVPAIIEVTPELLSIHSVPATVEDNIWPLPPTSPSLSLKVPLTYISWKVIKLTVSFPPTTPAPTLATW